jgi:anti-anti-sigma factor
VDAIGRAAARCPMPETAPGSPGPALALPTWGYDSWAPGYECAGPCPGAESSDDLRPAGSAACWRSLAAPFPQQLVNGPPGRATGHAPQEVSAARAARRRVAAPLESFPIRWAGPLAIVTLPAEVDALVADQVRDTLLAVLTRGVAVLIVDMAATTSCSCPGAGAVARAHQRATACGAQVRVAASATVRHRLAITGIDRLVPVFDSVSDAAARRSDTGHWRQPSEGRPQPVPRPVGSSADGKRDAEF